MGAKAIKPDITRLKCNKLPAYCPLELVPSILAYLAGGVVGARWQNIRVAKRANKTASYAGYLLLGGERQCES